MTRRRQIPATIPAWRRRAVYGLALGTWVSGCLWVGFRYFVIATDEFGFEGAHPLQKVWLIAHAALAYAAVWMLGVLWPSHVLPGWRRGTRRTNGGSLAIVLTWLAISGFLLYYIGDPIWRDGVALGHWIVGIASAGLFIIHLPLVRGAASGRRPCAEDD